MGFTAVTIYRHPLFGLSSQARVERVPQARHVGLQYARSVDCKRDVVRLARRGGVVSRHVTARHRSVLIQIDTHRLNQRIQAG